MHGTLFIVEKSKHVAKTKKKKPKTRKEAKRGCGRESKPTLRVHLNTIYFVEN